MIGAFLYVSCYTGPDILYTMNKLAKFSHNSGIIHFRVLIHLIGFIQTTSYKGLKYYSNHLHSPVYYKSLSSNNVQTTEESYITFSDSSWNDYVDTGRSTGWYISFNQGGSTYYGSHIPVPVVMSSVEAEYISAAVACMRASHLRMLTYDLRSMGCYHYDQDIVKLEPDRIIIYNEATICMAKCNKDTAGNCHVAKRYHYVQQGTALQEHKFEWIRTKHQLADPLTKPGSEDNFLEL